MLAKTIQLHDFMVLPSLGCLPFWCNYQNTPNRFIKISKYVEKITISPLLEINRHFAILWCSKTNERNPLGICNICFAPLESSLNERLCEA